MATPYTTPVEPDPQQSSSWGWLYGGAAALATVAAGSYLHSNPLALYKASRVKEQLFDFIGGTGILGAQRMKASFGRAFGAAEGAAYDAASNPAATRALRPDLLRSVLDLLDVVNEAGSPDKIPRKILEAKYKIQSNVGEGVSRMTVGNFLGRMEGIKPGTPYTMGRYTVDPMEVEGLKKAVADKLIDKDWVLDKGLFVKGNEIVNAGTFNPSKWAEGIVSGIRKLPLGSFLTDTVLPISHFTRGIPDIARVSKQSVLSKGMDPKAVDSVYAMGDKVYAFGKGKMVELEGMKVGPVGNAIARANAYNKELVKGRSVEEMRAAGVHVGPVKAGIVRASKNWFVDKVLGLSPGYVGETSLPGQLTNWFSRFANDAIKPVSTIPGKNTAEMMAGLNPWEKLKLKMKMNVHGLNWLTTEEGGAYVRNNTAAAREVKRRAAASWVTKTPYGAHRYSAQRKAIASKMGQELDETALEELYSYNNLDLAVNIAHATVETPFRVAETMFGIGLKPDKLGRTIFRATIGVPAAGYLAWEGSKYVDYMSESATGFSPIKTMLGAYTQAQVFRQTTLNLLGISAATKLAQETTGLDPDSPLGNLAKMSMLPIMGAAIGRKLTGMPRKGFWVGAGLAALTVNDDMTMKAEDLSDIYAGKKDIAVRKSRWWSLGVDPYMGGDVSYYRPHMIASIMSDAAYTESQYGSKSEYWSHGSILPTPSNLFGASIIADPYYYERKHYYDRPYPVTGGMFKEVPIWGNILDSTVGSIIKPRKVMHPDELNQYITQTPEWSGEKGMEGFADRLGLQQIRQGKVIPRVEGTQDDIGHAIYDMTEFAGLKGFLMSTMKDKVTGSPDFSDTGARWAMSDDIYSRAREYYDMQLGGLAGASEFFRRFLPHRQTQIDYVNPLANTMPTWLPGKRSEFDDSDFIDFHHGDPYTKLPEGEKRLPGAAYEAIHELHSKKPGYYDAFDRMRVLADIAPYSNAFKYYKNVVDQMADDGQLTGEFMNSYKQINARVMGANLPGMGDLPAGGDMSLVADQPRHMAGDFMGLRIPWVGDKLMHKDPDPLRKYQEQVVLGNDFSDWTAPVDTMLMPFMRSQSNAGAISGGLGGAALGVLAAQTGSPYAAPIGIAAAAAGAAWGAIGVGTPEAEKRRRDTEEYFDSLRFLKLRKLEKTAREKGNAPLANRAAMMTKRTMVGLDYDMEPTEFYKSAYSALPKRDRAYLQAFIQANPKDRPEIINTVPDYMNPILMKLWGQSVGEGRSARKESALTQGMADAKAVETVQSHGGIPDDDWIGWNPDVDLQDIKLKTASATGQDIHDYSFWGNDERDIERSKPYIRPLPFKFDSRKSSYRMLSFKQKMVQYGFEDSYVNMVQNPSQNPRDNYSVQINRDRTGDIASLTSRQGDRF